MGWRVSSDSKELIPPTAPLLPGEGREAERASERSNSCGLPGPAEGRTASICKSAKACTRRLLGSILQKPTAARTPNARPGPLTLASTRRDPAHHSHRPTAAGLRTDCCSPHSQLPRSSPTLHPRRRLSTAPDRIRQPHWPRPSLYSCARPHHARSRLPSQAQVLQQPRVISRRLRPPAAKINHSTSISSLLSPGPAANSPSTRPTDSPPTARLPAYPAPSQQPPALPLFPTAAAQQRPLPPVQTPDQRAVPEAGARRSEQPRMRSSIACARCRRSKVKCVNNGVGTTCRACETTGRECTYPSPAAGAAAGVAVARRESSSQSGNPVLDRVPAGEVRFNFVVRGLFCSSACGFPSLLLARHALSRGNSDEHPSHQGCARSCFSVEQLPRNLDFFCYLSVMLLM